MKEYKPILITGVPRSGATFIARIFDLCNVDMGKCDKMQENVLFKLLDLIVLSDIYFPDLVLEDTNVEECRIFTTQLKECINTQKLTSKWAFKDSNLTLTWRLWHEIFPKAQWVIVRRKTPHIINSCIKTNYMNLMKNNSNLIRIGVETEEEGWLWLIHKYEKEWGKMYNEGLDIVEVFPDRMENCDYSKIKEMIEWTDTKWNNEVIETMKKYF